MGLPGVDRCRTDSQETTPGTAPASNSTRTRPPDTKTGCDRLCVASRSSCDFQTNADACVVWLSSERPNLKEARAAVESIAQDGTRASEVIQHIRAPPFRPDGNRDGRLRREHSRPWCTQTPPAAGTLKRPSVLLGAKTINPSLFQAPPKPSSASQPAGLHRLSGPVRPKNSFSLASRPRKRR